MRAPTILLSLLAAFGCGSSPRLDGDKGLLPVGAVAPDLVGKSAQGAATRLSDAKGRFAVVYFYPKDETPGCTKQACAFRDAFDAFESAGVRVFGVSRDSEDSHQKFRAHHELPFALVADESGDVQAAYGVPSRMPRIAARTTFLVDRDGKVARVWKDVDPVLNVSEVLSAVRQLAQH